MSVITRFIGLPGKRLEADSDKDENVGVFAINTPGRPVPPEIGIANATINN
jgi:hypothetical protein